jgi:hypothetical protein
MESQITTVKLSQMSWHFSAPVIDAFTEIGIPVPSGLTSFILKVLSMKVVKEGATDLAMMGLPLKIVKQKYNLFVYLNEESEAE